MDQRLQRHRRASRRAAARAAAVALAAECSAGSCTSGSGPRCWRAGARDLRTYTFLPWSRFAPTRHLASATTTRPPPLPHGAVVFGIDDRAAVDTVLASDHVAALVADQHGPTAVHASRGALGAGDPRAHRTGIKEEHRARPICRGRRADSQRRWWRVSEQPAESLGAPPGSGLPEWRGSTSRRRATRGGSRGATRAAKDRHACPLHRPGVPGRLGVRRPQHDRRHPDPVVAGDRPEDDEDVRHRLQMLSVSDPGVSFQRRRGHEPRRACDAARGRSRGSSATLRRAWRWSRYPMWTCADEVGMASTSCTTTAWASLSSHGVATSAIRPSSPLLSELNRRRAGLRPPPPRGGPTTSPRSASPTSPTSTPSTPRARSAAAVQRQLRALPRIRWRFAEGGTIPMPLRPSGARRRSESFIAPGSRRPRRSSLAARSARRREVVRRHGADRGPALAGGRPAHDGDPAAALRKRLPVRERAAVASPGGRSTRRG